MMKKYWIVFFLTIIALTADAKVWILSNTNLEVKFDDKTALLTVTDKRCNKSWQQSSYKDQLLVSNTVQKGNTLLVSFTGKNVFDVTFVLTAASALEMNISAQANMQMNELEFPSAFNTINKNHYLLYTDGGGFLLPADDTEYPVGNGVTYFCGGGLSMAWMGMTDSAFKTGYMAILETPFDAALRTKRQNGLVTFSTIWLASMGEFGYNRKVTYQFFDKGGYVAQCKKYREYAWKKNNVITLKENEKKTPALAKMIGAPHIYVWDSGREVSFAKELKESGIEKALILWDANHTPYPEIGYDLKLKELGYAAGIYELFTDLKVRDTATYKVDENGPMRFALTAYPGLFNDLAARKKDGKTYFNQFGHTSCPVAIRPQIRKRVEREMKEYPHEAYFLDVYQANGLFECYAPGHRLTRQQFAEAVISNYKFIADTYGQYMGGEWGADYVGSNSVFVHGMMTLQRSWFGSDITKKGTIYWYGDWKSNPRPSQMLGTRVAPPTYLKYSINEYTRVPLFELVYHDAIVTSWRWEDGNHHNPEIWWKKDLFNILYGSSPLWNIDRDRWESFRNTFVRSYNDVMPWLQKIGYDELVLHRFITADHKVQESVFSSGKKAVVNFGDEQVVYEGETIKPRGFLFL
ncbi:MAG TPA: glycoside hydrolase [Chitinophagaceae bacterium]|nr:glycoside hydrolase [Chitinophagaceae bacterium]